MPRFNWLLHCSTTPQKTHRIDASLGFVDGAAIAADFGHMACDAFVFCDQFLTELEVGFFEN